MAVTKDITLTFNKPWNNNLNVSIQKKPDDTTAWTTQGNIDKGAYDIVYYQTADSSKIVELGPCIGITKTATSFSLTVRLFDGTSNTDPAKIPIQEPTSNDFIFFGKNKRIGASGMTGHYLEVKLEQTSGNQSELFAVGSEVFESSK
tara:strand:- start:439 stop:879 length:441 start_codon:yes stop_codon:yes gene_type:complete